MLGAGIFHAELWNICKPSVLDIEYLLRKSNGHYARRPARRRNHKINRDKILPMGAFYFIDSSFVLVHSKNHVVTLCFNLNPNV